MTVAGAAYPRRFAATHPELGAAVVVATAWLVLLVRDLQGGQQAASMPGMSPSPSYQAIPAGLAYWMVMCVAMMGPAALGAVRHTAVNSLQWRRRRAMAEFAGGYLGVWAAFGLVVVTATTAAPGVPGTVGLAVVLAAAAGWQLTVHKRRFLRDCHRSVPLPIRGWAAERGAVRFGLRNGMACLGSCWCLMLVMAVAPAGQLFWTAAISTVICAERLRDRPRAVSRLAAGGLMLGSALAVQLALA